MNFQELESKYLVGTYKRFPVELVSGKGSLAVDSTGKTYIDMGTGIAVNSFGVADELWQKAVTDQISKYQHTCNLFYSEPVLKLAQLLCEKTGMSKVFFSNSGAEANECSIKAARKYSAEKKGSDHNTIISLNNSFHGRTLATLAATGQEHYHELFQPLPKGFMSVDADDLEGLKKAAIENKAAGILIECVQGEGGVVPLSEDFVKGVDAFCKAEDIPFMVDEVQTGNGRSGEFYAYMTYGVSPDLVSTAKGIAGGLPLGVTYFSEKMKDVFAPGDHGTTFGGNPVSCAAAISVVERIDDELLSEVRKKSKMLFDIFSKAEGVESVSGLGLMIGIKTVKPADDIVAACREKGVLCLTAKDRVRLLPALNIPEDLMLKAAEIICSACKE